MPRARRVNVGGLAYHVVNRGNQRARIFETAGDYAAFIKVLEEAKRVVPLRILGYCLMPNHWHLVLYPELDGQLSRFVGWATSTHVRRYQRFRGSDGLGHVYQGRFRSFVIEQDHHLLTVLRYVEGNALRAGMVEGAEEWMWSSAHARMTGLGSGLLDEWPVDRPADWLEIVNRQMAQSEITDLRRSVERGRPFGAEAWVARTAERLGLASTLRNRGRPSRNGIGG
jgi:putative transposase